MIDLAALEQTLRGSVIRPGDPMYDAGRRTRNAMLDRHPVAIARPAATSTIRPRTRPRTASSARSAPSDSLG